MTRRISWRLMTPICMVRNWRPLLDNSHHDTLGHSCCSRSAGWVDRALNPVLLEGISVLETVMPHLGDSDIGALIAVLDREKRLGILTGRTRNEQEAAFRGQAGRQLLVAMIQATSGRKLEEKAFEELTDLDTDGQFVYAILATASAQRFGLSRDEILIACGQRSNTALNALDHLIRRHVVSTRPDGTVWARHRHIAEIVRDELAKRGQLTAPVAGLALLAASKVSSNTVRSARPWRMLRAFINHDFLMRIGGLPYARNLYGSLQSPLGWDYQFWLQRGSLEVEFGELPLAELFLKYR